MRTLAHLLRLACTSALVLTHSGCADDEGSPSTTSSSSTSSTSSSTSTSTSNSVSASDSLSSTGDSSSTQDSSSSQESTASSTDESTASSTTSSSETSSDSSISASSSDSSSESTSSTETFDPKKLPDKVVEASCNWATKCCDSGEFAEILGPYVDDAANCAERLKEQLHQNDDKAESNRLRFLGTPIADLAYTVNLNASYPIAGGIDGCAEALALRSCNAPATVNRCTTPASDRCSLSRLFGGKLEAGAECNGKLRGPRRDIECKYGTNCEDTDKGEEDIFRCITKGKLDQPCEPESQYDDGSCEFDLYCEATTGTCRPRPILGERCAYIDPSAPHITNVNALYANDPDVADTNRGNEKIPCIAGLICDPVGLTCVADCTAGDVCGAPAEHGFVAPGAKGDRECPSGLGCQPVQFAENIGAFYFTCGALRAPEGICDTDADCAADLHCNGVAPIVPSKSSDQDTLIDGNPGRGVCKPDRGELEICSRDGECAQGNYCKPCSFFASHGLEAPSGCVDESLSSDAASAAIDPSRGICAGYELFDTPCAKDIGCGPTSLGCLWTDRNSRDEAVAFDRYCLANALPINARCEIRDALSDRKVNFANTGNYLKLRAPMHAGETALASPWLDYCETENAICADPDQNGTFNCVNGAQLGQPCDYNPQTDAKPFCAAGLHCVNSTCVPFLATGTTCDPATNDAAKFNAVAYADSGFPKPMCDPDISICDAVHGSHYCAPLDVDTTRRIWCDGGGIKSEK